MPGMFSKSEESTMSTSHESSHTVIGTTVHIEGTLKSDEDVVIAGSLNGTVTTSKNISIHAGAKIDGDVHAHDVLVSGQVTGDITAAGTATLTKTARVTGDVVASNIAIEHGAQLKGQMTTQSAQ